MICATSRLGGAVARTRVCAGSLLESSRLANLHKRATLSPSQSRGFRYACNVWLLNDIDSCAMHQRSCLCLMRHCQPTA